MDSDSDQPRSGPPPVPPISAPISRSGSGGHIGFIRQQQSESARANQNRARNNFGEVPPADKPEQVHAEAMPHLSACSRDTHEAVLL